MSQEEQLNSPSLDQKFFDAFSHFGFGGDDFSEDKAAPQPGTHFSLVLFFLVASGSLTLVSCRIGEEEAGGQDGATPAEAPAGDGSAEAGGGPKVRD